MPCEPPELPKRPPPSPEKAQRPLPDGPPPPRHPFAQNTPSVVPTTLPAPARLQFESLSLGAADIPHKSAQKAMSPACSGPASYFRDSALLLSNPSSSCSSPVSSVPTLPPSAPVTGVSHRTSRSPDLPPSFSDVHHAQHGSQQLALPLPTAPTQSTASTVTHTHLPSRQTQSVTQLQEQLEQPALLSPSGEQPQQRQAASMSQPTRQIQQPMSQHAMRGLLQQPAPQLLRQAQPSPVQQGPPDRPACTQASRQPPVPQISPSMPIDMPYSLPSNPNETHCIFDSHSMPSASTSNTASVSTSPGSPSKLPSSSLSPCMTGLPTIHSPISEVAPSVTATQSFEPVDPDLSSDEAEEDHGTDELHLELSDLPDTSRVNRLPPNLDPPRSVPFSSSITTGALFREMIVVATQEKLRVLVVRRGAQFHTSDVPDQSTEMVVHQTVEHYARLGSPSNMSPSSRDLRVSTLAFCPSVQVGSEVVAEGRVVWYGTPAGHIAELDTQTGKITAVRMNVHKAPIVHIARIGKAIVCVDESGKISTWVPRASPINLLNTTPETMRITLPKNSYVSVQGSLLWVCSPTLMTKLPAKPAQRTLSVRCYSPISDTRPFNVMSQPGQWPMSGADGIGAVTCSAMLPITPGVVYFGHDSGHVSVWNEHGHCVDRVRVSTVAITSMVGALNCIWSGTRHGRIVVHKPQIGHARMIKLWQAHRDNVFLLLFDGHGIEPDASECMVCSISTDNYVTFWDACLSCDWVHSEISNKADQYSTYSPLRILMMTYNLGAASPSDLFGKVDNMDLFQRVLRSSCSTVQRQDGSSVQVLPDVIAFSLQELIDLEDKRLTAKRLLLGGNKQRRAPGKESMEERERLPSRYRAWLDKLMGYVRLVMPPETPFSVLLTENLLGLFTCIFVRSDLLPRIRHAYSYTVKTGLGGHYGNKGAVVTRFVIDDTSLCFLNCHLAAGQRNVRQRNRDIADILQSSCPVPTSDDLAFPLGGDGSMILDHEICLLAGDLNYRLDLSREAAILLIEQQRFSDLLAADQLQMEIRMNPQFGLRDFHEAPICFAPTYKFNRLTNDYDTSEKSRVPAYCDRIMYRSHLNNMVHCTSYKRWDATVSDHRPVSATFNARLKLIDKSAFDQVAERSRVDFLQYRAQLIRSTWDYFKCI